MGCTHGVPRDAARASPRQVVAAGVGPPREVHVHLTKAARASFGMRLVRTQFGVMIREFDADSTIERWNARHPSAQVGCGDRIISVNGTPVDSSFECWCTLLAQLRKNSVHLVVVRSVLRPPLPFPDADASLDRVLPTDFLEHLRVSCPQADSCDLDACAICLEDLRAGGDLARLPCGHEYHFECAERWLTRCPTYRHARCPTCRAPVRVDFDPDAGHLVFQRDKRNQAATQ